MRPPRSTKDAPECDQDLDAFVAASIQDVVSRVQDTSLLDTPCAGTATEAAHPAARRAPSGSTLRPHAASDGSHRADAAAAAAGGAAHDVAVRLLRSRLAGLEDQLRAALSANAEKDRQLAQQERELRSLSADKAAWTKQHQALEVQLEKQRQEAQDAQQALAQLERQAREGGKDAARAERERRAAELEARSRDQRLQRALEEVSRFKSLLQDATREHEARHVARPDLERALSEVKRLERQKADLLAVARKQLKLIDVLRSQRAHLEAAKHLAITEEMFVGTLRKTAD